MSDKLPCKFYRKVDCRESNFATCLRGIMLAIKIIGLLVMVLYGFSFGIRKSQMWAVSVVTIFLMDMLIVETIHVFVRAWFVQCYLRVSLLRHRSGDVHTYVLNLGFFRYQTHIVFAMK